MSAPGTDDPRFTAAIDLVSRNGARSVQIRYSDDEEPVVWMAVAEFHLDPNGKIVRGDGTLHYEAAGALHPLVAMFRLCGQLMDGGQCTHCDRPTGFDEDFAPMPLDELVCWYQWDPERERFRRGCEGVDAVTVRDPVPCTRCGADRDSRAVTGLCRTCYVTSQASVACPSISHYNRGCRCDACRELARTERRRYRRRAGAAPDRVTAWQRRRARASS